MTYNDWHDTTEEQFAMPKNIKKNEETFGERLARLRHAAGYSQRELSKEIGVTHPMLFYYEKQAEYPSARLLPGLAKALGVSTDQLLGIEKTKTNGQIRDTKLWRRFSQMEKLPATRRKPIMQVIDSFLKGEKLEKTE